MENGLLPIAATYRSYITERGNSIVDERIAQLAKEASKEDKKNKVDPLNDPTFIQTLLDVHDHFKNIVTTCFNQDSLFQKSLKEAFEVFINRDMGKHPFAALMSSYCNRILKKGGTSSSDKGQRLSDDDLELLLTKIVDLFNFLTDKDLFAEIYRNQLAKRYRVILATFRDLESFERFALLISEISQTAGGCECERRCGAQYDFEVEDEVWSAVHIENGRHVERLGDCCRECEEFWGVRTDQRSPVLGSRVCLFLQFRCSRHREAENLNGLPSYCSRHRVLANLPGGRADVAEANVRVSRAFPGVLQPEDPAPQAHVDP